MGETQVFIKFFIKNDKQGDSFHRIELQGGKIKVFRVKVEVPADIFDLGKEEEIERGERLEAPFTVEELLILGWSCPEEWGLGEISEEDVLHIGLCLDTTETYYRAGNGYVWDVLGPAEALHLICYGERDLAVIQNT